MKLSRKLVMSAGALVLPLGLLSFVGVQLIGNQAASAVVVANGTINCTKVAATVTFVPPIETTGDTNSAKAVIAGTVSGCTYTSTNIGTGAVSGKIKATFTTITTNNSANSCAGLATNSGLTRVLALTWTHTPAIAGTKVTFSGYDVVSNGAFAGFDLPQDSGGSASIAAGGSFAGTDGGATSEANAFVTLTSTQITAACNGATNDGLKTLKLGHAGTVADPSHAHFG